MCTPSFCCFLPEMGWGRELLSLVKSSVAVTSRWQQEAKRIMCIIHWRSPGGSHCRINYCRNCASAHPGYSFICIIVNNRHALLLSTCTCTYWEQHGIWTIHPPVPTFYTLYQGLSLEAECMAGIMTLSPVKSISGHLFNRERDHSVCTYQHLWLC